MSNPAFLLENCTNSVASCIEAERGGAGRIELCAGLPEGGTTPSIGTVVVALEHTSIPIYPIIRPRAGDFLYSSDEIDSMECDIRMMVDLGVHGVVLGALTRDGNLDIPTCERLIKAAQGLPVTLHRAFDMVQDPMTALKDAIKVGFSRILTSGCEPTAYEGRHLIAKLIEVADNQIIIMPGCGINRGNILDIANDTGAVEFHASLRTSIPSAMTYRNNRVSMGGTVTIDEYAEPRTDYHKVREMIEILEEI